MTAAEFREILDRLGLTAYEAAGLLTREPKTLYRWLNGEVAIPEVAAKALRKWR